MTNQQLSPVGLRPGTGTDTPIDLLGVTINVKLTSADTSGAFALVDHVAPPHGEGIRTHWHARTTEWVYVIDGLLACTLGDHTVTATPGTTIVVPPTVVHTLWNPTAAPVRFLSLFAPGGCEGYFAELAALVAINKAPIVDVMALAARHDTLLPDHPI
jgi:mannose-6-phosphate isomerase-like protein (cupin superfamily)